VLPNLCDFVDVQTCALLPSTLAELQQRELAAVAQQS
jgi:hypothetical protein